MHVMEATWAVSESILGNDAEFFSENPFTRMMFSSMIQMQFCPEAEQRTLTSMPWEKRCDLVWMLTCGASGVQGVDRWGGACQSSHVVPGTQPWAPCSSLRPQTAKTQEGRAPKDLHPWEQLLREPGLTRQPPGTSPGHMET